MEQTKVLKPIIVIAWILLALPPVYGATDRAPSRPFNRSPIETPAGVIDFQKLDKLKYTSLVFASQDPKSPASAFGHTLIIFHNHPKKEIKSNGLKKSYFFAQYMD